MHASVPYSLMTLSVPNEQAVRSALGKLTGSGIVLFLSGLAVLGSGFAQLRPSVFGMLIHPYLIPIGLAFPFLLVSRIQRFPTNTLFGLSIFTVIYIFSTLSGSWATPETPKIVSGAIVIFSAALLVRSCGDFVAGSVGLSIAVGILALRGLEGEGDAAVAAMDVANKNAYSLFALPSILLGCFIILNFPTIKWVKAILLLSSAMSTVAIFSSGNRSGYVGVLLVLLMLMIGRKLFGVLLFATIVVMTAVGVMQLGTENVAQQRIERTFNEKMATDTKRVDLFWASLQIGLENPFIGVSPDGLRYELARRVDPGQLLVDPHNVFASVIGGSGVVCFLALIYIGWTLVTLKPNKQLPSADMPRFRLGCRLSRMLVVLWVVRGMFTREILYNPSFCLAIGMVIGLCLVTGGYLHKFSAVKIQPA